MPLIIDLNFYGPYRSVWTLQNALNDSGHSRTVYMARHPNITAIAEQRELSGQAIDAERNREKCNVAYIGITAQNRLGNRFGSEGDPDSHHHKVGPAKFNKLMKGVAGKGTLTDFWAGYFARPTRAPATGERHERRLLVAEDVLISWFQPPLNKQGVQRPKRAAGRIEVGSGSFASATVNLHWWTAGNGANTVDRERAAPPNFPKTIVYDRSIPELTAIY